MIVIDSVVDCSISLKVVMLGGWVSVIGEIVVVAIVVGRRKNVGLLRRVSGGCLFTIDMVGVSVTTDSVDDGGLDFLLKIGRFNPRKIFGVTVLFLFGGIVTFSITGGDAVFLRIGRRNPLRIAGGGGGGLSVSWIIETSFSISMDGGCFTSFGIISGGSVLISSMILPSVVVNGGDWSLETFDPSSNGFCFRLRIKFLRSFSRFSLELDVVISGLVVVKVIVSLMMKSEHSGRNENFIKILYEKIKNFT